ncbi:hypothetical protein N752_10935 [Desulforamulus aquiferis]|nr:YetF domain-containing protein [Desulforamulus aquiferis]RYD05079.1 hypothetical protein N752_10935 [Desulforamulus aquiferis]
MPDMLMVLMRSVGFFALAFLLIRLLGKRLSTRLTIFDQVNVIVIAVIVAIASINLNINAGSGVLALLVWIVLPVAIHYLSLKYKTFRDLFQGKETILINNGKVLEDKLLEARFTPEDLLSKLRRKNAFKVADVEFAMLEPNGEISVLLKKDKQPLTASTAAMKSVRKVSPRLSCWTAK